MTIWFDVEDLVQFFQTSSRPTGIQRLSFETYRAVWRLAGESGEVRFCRWGATPNSLVPIHFPALEAGILTAASAPPPPPPRPAPPAPLPVSRLARAAKHLPLRYRLPLGTIFRAGLSTWAAVRALAAIARADLRPRRDTATQVGGHQYDLGAPDIAFAPGDWFVNLGASWATPYEPAFLAGLRAGGVKFALLAYDLIPELFPEWFTQGLATDFSVWLREIVPQTDKMFAISRHTAADLTACLARIGKPLPSSAVLPVGNRAPGFSQALAPVHKSPYVLMVGTIEARKNHAAMLRVWRRMLQTMPADAVPDLIFAGKIGWLTRDLVEQLHNASWLGGKIRFIDSPSEATLASLYQHCLFSVFPSLYEGWGLPVTESLGFGKTVAASSSSAIPEAGGTFCTYFDPNNVNDIYNVVRGLIENPERIAVLQTRIAAQFCPPAWEDAATALLMELGLAASGAMTHDKSPQLSPQYALSSDM